MQEGTEILVYRASGPLAGILIPRTEIQDAAHIPIRSYNYDTNRCRVQSADPFLCASLTLGVKIGDIVEIDGPLAAAQDRSQ